MNPFAKPLNKSSGMPQMGAAFAGWAQTITIFKINQIVTDGFVKNDNGAPYQFDQDGEFNEYDVYGQDWDQKAKPVTKVVFQGVIQPLSPKAIALKPEGQRAWTWLQIHCFAGSLNLTTNDRIIYNGSRYKVMAVLDYSLNNYIEYHVVRDYQNGGAEA